MIIEPNYLRSLSFAELKQQYSKSRSKMQKRKDRLDKAGFNTGFQNFVNNWNQGGKISTISSLRRSTGDNIVQMRNSMIYIISELERYAEDPRTYVSYQRQQREELAEEFRESGYNISNEDVNDFIEFLDWAHNSSLDHMLYTETYEANSAGFGRSKRKPRTDKEKENVVKLFKMWKDNGKSLPEELIKEYL